jgi:hypothetical protein
MYQEHSIPSTLFTAFPAFSSDRTVVPSLKWASVSLSASVCTMYSSCLDDVYLTLHDANSSIRRVVEIATASSYSELESPVLCFTRA